MKLYSIDLSPNCVRVRAVANELGLDLDIVDVDIQAETKTETFLAMNPNGKVPVLDDDGMILWESRAINVYLAAKKPEQSLYPEDPAIRAVVDQWSYWGAIHFGPAIQRVTFERVLKSKFGMGDADESAIADSVAETHKLLKVLNTGLDVRDWVAGSLSLADFAIATAFVLREPSGISLAAVPNVAGWISRIEERIRGPPRRPQPGLSSSFNTDSVRARRFCRERPTPAAKEGN